LSSPRLRSQPATSMSLVPTRHNNYRLNARVWMPQSDIHGVLIATEYWAVYVSFMLRRAL
jgi:hypothetical protein